jgi:hypothetical protein
MTDLMLSEPNDFIIFCSSVHQFIGYSRLLPLKSLKKYKCTIVSTGNTFQDLLRLRETTDNTEHYIRVTYINTVKFN